MFSLEQLLLGNCAVVLLYTIFYVKILSKYKCVCWLTNVKN